MEYTEIIIVKDCRGSEDGITVRAFHPSDVPVKVEGNLAKVFLSIGDAILPGDANKPGPNVKKVVKPEIKTVVPENTKSSTKSERSKK